MWKNSELAKHWTTILACGVGVGAGTTGIPFYTLGLFIGPLEQEFGWTRAQVSSMFLVFVIAGLLVMPLIGWMTDRFGSRQVALTALLGTIVGYLSLGLLTHSLITFYVGAALLGLLGTGTSPITWTKVIGGWFNKQRGLALGLSLAGTGVAAFLAPKYVNLIMSDSYRHGWGWREAYIGLAIIPLVAFLIVFRLLKDPISHSGQKDNSYLYGVDLKTATKSYRLWVLILAFFMISAAISGTIPNLFPLLTGKGLEPAKAASILGLLGVSVILGRLVAGFCLDRIWAPAVAAFMLVMPAIALVMLSQQEITVYQVVIAVFLIGLTAGAEFDLMAYLVSRYFGLAHYGKIYAILYGAFFLAAGFGPMIFGHFYDMYSSYAKIMLWASGLFVAGGLSILLLGRYPDLEKA